MALKDKSNVHASSYSTAIQGLSSLDQSNFFFGIGFHTKNPISKLEDYVTLDTKNINTNDPTPAPLTYSSCKDKPEMQKFTLPSENMLCVNFDNTKVGGSTANYNDQLFHWNTALITENS
jgi:hypothetical protein